MDLMSRLPGNFGLKELGYLTAGVVGFTLLIAGVVSALSIRRGARKDAFGRVVLAWHRLCEQVGVPVRTGETPPATLAERLADARPEVESSVRLFARAVNSHYYTASTQEASAHEARRLTRLLKTMKRQLRRKPEPASRTFRHD